MSYLKWLLAELINVYFLFVKQEDYVAHESNPTTLFLRLRFF